MRKKHTHSRPRTKQKPKLTDHFIIGRHAVISLLEHGTRPVTEIWCVQQDNFLHDLAKKYRVKWIIKSKKDFENQFETQVHQGIAAKAAPLPALAIEDVLHKDLLLILDQVTDPHNLGAILRSADAFGCGAIIVPSHGRAPISEITAKTACGATETVPVVEVTNLNRTIEKLQKNDFWVIGLDGATDTNLANITPSKKTCLVMGSEGKGLRDLVAKHCDQLAKLPMVGTVESLNVSVAAAISLYIITNSTQ